MALTSEFISAVREKNNLRVRIMLKDSLLVDKTFKQFTEMQRFAEDNGAYFWMEPQEELEKLPKENWTMDVMNLELTKLVNDFTKERLDYCQAIVRYIYGVRNLLTQPYKSQRLHQDTSRVSSSQSVNTTRTAQVQTNNSTNNDDYATIIRSFSNLNRELNKHKTRTGRTWTDEEIDKIYRLSKSMEKACDNIIRRRK